MDFLFHKLRQNLTGDVCIKISLYLNAFYNSMTWEKSYYVEVASLSNIISIMFVIIQFTEIK